MRMRKVPLQRGDYTRPAVMLARSPAEQALRSSLLGECGTCLGRFQCVLDQRSDRHRTDPPGDGCAPVSLSRSRLEIDVTHQSAIVEAVDADIDHHRAGLDPVTL